MLGRCVTFCKLLMMIRIWCIENIRAGTTVVRITVGDQCGRVGIANRVVKIMSKKSVIFSDR